MAKETGLENLGNLTESHRGGRAVTEGAGQTPDLFRVKAPSTASSSPVGKTKR